MDGRIINQNELDILFYEEFTQLQVSHIFKIINILAQYVFLNSHMLMELYMTQNNEKMGLSYLKRAVGEKLIIEYQEDINQATEKSIFYYALKSSTILYLQHNNISAIKMSVSSGYTENQGYLPLMLLLLKKGIP